MALKVFSIPALPRVNNGAARLLPVATTLLAAVISVLPLQIPGYAALTPVFTLMAAYHWTIYRPDLLPPVALFGIGLAEDLLAGSPMGVNALLLLLTRVAVLGYRRYFVNRNFAFVWTGFTLLAAAAMLGLWGLHCVIDLSLLDFRNAVIRAALTVAMFPLASFMLGRAQRTVMGAG
ncbi:MAG TPA: rod shape-determining protein MreD [Stellaceae bacterium]|jgi:rod shape-determining protein MreD|nr:rod shape-determining protein MreD [Stellaceae bacterium]